MKKYREPTEQELREMRERAERKHRENLCRIWGTESYEVATQKSREMTRYLEKWGNKE